MEEITRNKLIQIIEENELKTRELESVSNFDTNSIRLFSNLKSLLKRIRKLLNYVSDDQLESQDLSTVNNALFIHLDLVLEHYQLDSFYAEKFAIDLKEMLVELKTEISKKIEESMTLGSQPKKIPVRQIQRKPEFDVLHKLYDSLEKGTFDKDSFISQIQPFPALMDSLILYYQKDQDRLAFLLSRYRDSISKFNEMSYYFQTIFKGLLRMVDKIAPLLQESLTFSLEEAFNSLVGSKEVLREELASKLNAALERLGNLNNEENILLKKEIVSSIQYALANLNDESLIPKKILRIKRRPWQADFEILLSEILNKVIGNEELDKGQIKEKINKVSWKILENYKIRVLSKDHHDDDFRFFKIIVSFFLDKRDENCTHQVGKILKQLIEGLIIKGDHKTLSIILKIANDYKLDLSIKDQTTADTFLHFAVSNPESRPTAEILNCLYKYRGSNVSVSYRNTNGETFVDLLISTHDNPKFLGALTLQELDLEIVDAIFTKSPSAKKMSQQIKKWNYNLNSSQKIVQRLSKATNAKNVIIEPETLEELYKHLSKYQQDIVPLLNFAALLTYNFDDEGSIRKLSINFFHDKSILKSNVNSVTLGFYQSSSFSISIAGNRDKKSLCEVLIHEIAHLVADKIYNNGCKPYQQDDEEKKQRFTEICTNLHNIYRNTDSNPQLHPIIGGAFSYYNENSFHSELVVRIVQLIVELGSAEKVKELHNGRYGELLEYYRDCFLIDCKKAVEKMKSDNFISNSMMKKLNYYDTSRKSLQLVSLFKEGNKNIELNKNQKLSQISIQEEKKEDSSKTEEQKELSNSLKN